MKNIFLKILFSSIVLAIFAAVCFLNYNQAFSQEPGSHKQYNLTVEQYLKYAQSNKKAFLALASFMKERGKYRESIRYLKEYLKNNDDKKAKLLLGEVYYLNANDKKSLSVLKSLNIKGCQYEIYIYLGLVYEELNRTALAVKYYKKSISLRKNSISLYRLGKIFYKKGDYQKAARFFRELIDYDASNRLAYYYLGDSYFQLNEFAKSYKYMLKAFRFYPKSAVVSDKFSMVKKRLGKAYFIAEKKKLLERRKRIKLAAYKPLGKNIPKVRVSVLEKVKSVSFKSSGRITLKGKNKSIILENNKLYTIKFENGNIVLKKYKDNKIMANLECPLVLKSGYYPFYILGAVYGKGNFWQSTLDLSLRGSIEIIRNNDYFTVINVLSVEEYLYGVLPSEIYPSSGLEALKAQAVAARTLVFKNLGRHRKEGFDFCSGVHCQVYRGMKEYPSTNKAVDATRGEVMAYDGKLIEALYHSNCGGCLRSDAFGKRPYLENKLDTQSGQIFTLSPWDIERWFKDYPESFCRSLEHISNFRWQRIYDAQDFSIVYGEPIDKFVVGKVKRGECAHIRLLDISIASRKIVLDRDLEIRRFFDNLKSSAFIVEVKYVRKKNNIVPGIILLWGAGFGHGEGMCQQGASGMAKDGYNYKDILKHYYKNVNIEKLY